MRFLGNPSTRLTPNHTASTSPWLRATDPETGYIYYYNQESGESTWEEPAGFSENQTGATRLPGDPSSQGPRSSVLPKKRSSVSGAEVWVQPRPPRTLTRKRSSMSDAASMSAFDVDIRQLQQLDKGGVEARL